MKEEDLSTTQELKIAQLQREQAEEQTAEAEPTPDGTEKHARRAEKAAYLKQKLAEREAAEREALREDARES